MTLLRRGLLLALLPALAGCGFRPLYGGAGAAAGADGPAAQGLAATNVLRIPERTGQILREALQARFQRGGAGLGQRYELSVQFGIGGEGIGIETNNAISRVRLVGTANWTLFAPGTTRRTLTSGTARQIDAYDIVNEQYFASDLNSESVQRRMAEAVADQITLQLAAWFNKQGGA
jgi:LPS-assembly lipoprotein